MRLNRKAFFILPITVILSACGQQQDAEPPTSSLGPVNLPIIPDSVLAQARSEIGVFSALTTKSTSFPQKVFGARNPILLARMQGLPADQRRNVILVEGNKIYSTDDRLLEETQQLKQISSEKWVDETGKSIYMQDFEARPALTSSSDLKAQATYVNCRTDNSGPFSRVIAYPGKSRFYGTVTLPSNYYSVDQNISDSVHMYSGGWSSQIAVDAGFQRNADGRYQAIMRASRSIGYANVQPHHFSPGTGTIDFFTQTDGVVWLKAYGYVEELKRYDYIWTGFSSLPGWTADGSQAQTKFTTSVAQPAGNENFMNGSFIRSTWSSMYLGGNRGGWYINPWTNSSYDTQEVCSNPSPTTYPGDSRFWNRVESYWASNTDYQININLR